MITFAPPAINTTYYPNQTSRRAEYIENVEEVKEVNGTQFLSINNIDKFKKPTEKEGTNYYYESPQKKDDVAKYDLEKISKISENSYLKIGNYSKYYIEYNNAKFVEDLLVNFNYWIKNGTESSLHKISEIKDSINAYSKYLIQRDENRIFLSTIELVINNNEWDQLSEGQLKSFAQELKKFNDGSVEYDKLELFSKQINRLRFQVLKNVQED